MGDCTAVFTIAKNNMDAEISYYTGGGRDTTTLNAYRSQVFSALNGGTACAIPPQTPGDIFNANGVKYTNIGYPSNSFANAVVITTNNMPPNLRARLVAAYNAGWRFYVFRTPDDFKASALYSTLKVTSAEYEQIRNHGALTTNNPIPVEFFFENYYTTPTGKTLDSFVNTQNATATIAHEVEHINDLRSGVPSSNDAQFVAAYNAGVAAYNADTSHNPAIGANFVSNPNGKSELFAELGAYYDTSHWGVSGVTPAMSSKSYTPAQVLKYFSSAWTIMQTRKASNTW